MLDSLEDTDRSGRREMRTAANAVHFWKMPHDVSKPWPKYPHHTCKLCKIIRKILGGPFFCDFFSSRKSIYKVEI